MSKKRHSPIAACLTLVCFTAALCFSVLMTDADPVKAPVRSYCKARGSFLIPQSKIKGLSHYVPIIQGRGSEPVVLAQAIFRFDDVLHLVLCAATISHPNKAPPTYS